MKNIANKSLPKQAQIWDEPTQPIAPIQKKQSKKSVAHTKVNKRKATAKTKGTIVSKVRVTKRSKIENHLIQTKSITSLEAIDLFGATRLAATIFNLRADGWKIESQDKEALDRYGNKVVYAKYILLTLPKRKTSAKKVQSKLIDKTKQP